MKNLIERDLLGLRIAATAQGEEKKYWSNRLASFAEKVSFPPDAVPEAGAPDASLEVPLPANIAAGALRLSNGSDYSLHVLLLYSAGVLLYKYTGNPDVCLGTPLYTQAGDVDLINTCLVVRNQIAGADSVRRGLTGFSRAYQQDLENQNYPLEVLVEDFGYAPDSENPFFDASVVLENVQQGYHPGGIPGNVLFAFARENEEITLTLHYSAGHYTRPTAERLAQGFLRLLGNLYQSLDHPVDELQVLSESEKKTLLLQGTNLDVAYPRGTSIHRIFEAQAEQSPDGVALLEGSRQVTYRELNGRANAVAHHLLRRGVSTGALVALCLEPSVAMVAAIVGVLKAGAAYLPIDPGAPEARIRYMLQDSNPALLLHDAAFPLPAGGLACVDVQSLAAADAAWPANPDVPVSDADLAYVIFTSGTTGNPKGTLIEHKNVVRLLFNDAFQFRFGPGDTWTLFHSYAFDFSVWELFGALLTGGKLVIVPPAVRKDPEKFLDLLIGTETTVLNQTPSAFYNLMQSDRHRPAQLKLRYVVFGGEALIPAKVTPFLRRYPETALINMYGITETTVHTTFKQLEEADTRSGKSNIGKPLPTLNTYVLNPQMDLVPWGARGEIYVGGEGVARGYLNQPELTHEKFVENPYSPGDRLYKSGDLASVTPDGELIYIGRKDQQVKIRGFRVELKEIENNILAVAGVRQCALKVFKGYQIHPGHAEDAGNYICAYIVAEAGVSVEAIREALAARLPDYAVPAYFTLVDALPLTPNGKIDLNALEVPRRVSRKKYVAPATPPEEAVAAVFAELFALERVGLEDDFFELGGDSILSIRLVSLLNERLGCRIGIADVYQHPTVRELAAAGQRGTGNAGEPAALTTADKIIAELREKVLAQHPHLAGAEILPMSFIEKGMMHHFLRRDGEVQYFEQNVYRIPAAGFDQERFVRALTLLCRKHESLRTGYLMEDLAHVIYPDLAPVVACLDLSDNSPAAQEETIRRHMEQGKHTAHELIRGPLWRMTLFRLADDYHVLLMELLHAMFDGWSLSTFLAELAHLYAILARDPGYVPDELAITYRDFIRRELNRVAAEETRRYWQEELADYKRITFHRSHGENRRRQLARSLGGPFYRALGEQARNLDVPVKHLCFAAYAYTMHLFSYTADFVVGLTTNTRPPEKDGDKLLGCFLNTVPVNITIPRNATWSALVRSVDAKLRELKKHDGISLHEITKIVNEPVQPQAPFFDTKFNFVDFYVLNDIQLDGGPAAAPHPSPSVDNFIRENTLCDLQVHVTGNEFVFYVNYSTAFMDDADAQRVLTYYENVLNALLHAPDEMPAKRRVLTAGEEAELLGRFNDTQAPYEKNKRIIDLFAEQTAVAGDKWALSFQGNCLTYNQLHEQATRIAGVLAAFGIGPNDVVPILLDRSFALYTGIYGILKAGAAYLPIAPDYPDERIRLLVEEAGAKAILCASADYDRFKDLGPLVCTDRLDGYATAPVAAPGDARDLAYVIYTSGSTGQPKGVMIENQALVNRLNWMQKAYPLYPTDVIMQKTPVVFDVSVWEIFWWGLQGAAVAVLPPGQERNPQQIINLVDEERVTVIHFVPSMLAAFLEYLEANPAEIPKLKSLRIVFASGEELPRRLADAFHALLAPFNVELVNLYGPTEAAIDVTYYNCLPADERPVIPIGKPIDNTRIYILDENREVQPIGVTGELYIAGDGLARGYLRNEAVTRAKFLEGVLPGEGRLYRTGDLARWLPDGNIEYAGRVDNQVKIRGYRVELGEIESQLKKAPFVRNAVACIKGKDRGQQLLCAYVVVRDEVPRDEALTLALRAHLKRYLPEFMVPPFIEYVDQIPLTRNGKVDYRALPDPQRHDRQQPYVAPATPLEADLAALWEQVLQVSPIGVDDDYFGLGGDSLNAIQTISQINKKFDIALSLNELYAFATVRTLAQAVARGQKANAGRVASLAAGLEADAERYRAAAAGKIDPDEVEDVFPMSGIEQGMFYYSKLLPGRRLYLEQNIYRIHNRNLDVALVAKAFSLLIRKHAILRTGFDVEQSMHIVYKDFAAPVRYHDLSDRPVAGQEAFIRQQKEETRQAPASYLRPNWKVTLFKLGPDDHALLIEFHHAIMDGWSLHALLLELNDTYSSLAEGHDVELAPLQCSYKEYILEELLNREANEWQQYWREELNGYKRFVFPGSGLTAPADTGTPQVIDEDKGAAFLARVQAFCREQQLAPKHLCFAAYLLTLYTLSYENDIVAGLVTNNRPLHEDGDKLVGCFLNTVPVRFRIPTGTTGLEYLRQVHEKLINLKKYERVSLLSIKEAAGEKTSSQNPFFDTKFNFIDFYLLDGLLGQAPATNPYWQTAPTHRLEENTKCDFSVELTFKTFLLTCKYDADYIAPEEVRRLIDTFFRVMAFLLESPGAVLRKECFVDPAEKDQLQHQFNDTAAPFASEVTVTELLRQQFRRTPDAVAVVSQDQAMTYGCLDEATDRLASKLVRLGVGPGSVVGVLLERSLDMSIAIFAILKAGAAYLPISPEYPGNRIKYLVKDAAVKVVLTHQRFAEAVPYNCQEVLLDVPEAEAEPLAPLPEGAPTDVAYVIYTSGSTGFPKGVLVEHRALVNRLQWMQKTYGLGSRDVILQKTNYTFDVSVWELFWATLTGARLVYLAPGAEKSSLAVRDAVALHQVTTMHFVPSMLEVFLEGMNGEQAKLKSIRNVICSGEALLQKHVEGFNRAFGPAATVALTNLYGPTEATIDVTYYDCRQLPAGTSVPIGRPIDNIQLSIVDVNGELQPVGVPGELCIAGTGLGRGYLNRAELTAEKFVAGDGRSRYRTGDLARWLPDGNIEYIGRIDHQVKIRGLRIELGEIEYMINQTWGVSQGVVTVKNSGANSTLIAFVTSPEKVNVNQLKQALHAALPEYMVPSEVVQLDEIPLSQNGKVDRKALQNLAFTLQRNREIIEPRTPLEKEIAAIWQEVLSVDRISLTDNFIDLGGHSLLMMRVAARMGDQYGVEPEFREFFTQPFEQFVRRYGERIGESISQ